MSSINSISTSRCPPTSAPPAPDAIKDYKSAVGFEQMLAGQLIKSMVGEQLARRGPVRLDHAGHADLGTDQGHGLGLARQIYKEMQS